MAKAKRATAPNSDALGFEGALERLEGLVGELERGDLPLESALEAFEEGVALTRRCSEQLDAAERRVDTLAREGQQLVERSLERADEGE